MVEGVCQSCCSDPESCSLNCNGDVIQLVQTLTYETRYYTSLAPLRLVDSAEHLISEFCPNRSWESILCGKLEDGWLNTSFTTGKVYLNYEGALENKQGELLVPDHDGLNDYYEYALKQRIIENLVFNDEEVSETKITLVEARYKTARDKAVTIVNTPDFKELRAIYQGNRNAQYHKYYDMFLKYPRLNFR
jgi:hypothetical protein